MNWLLLALTNKLSKKDVKSTVQKMDACLQGQGHFQHLL
jgi:hypothetical protein